MERKYSQRTSIAAAAFLLAIWGGWSPGEGLTIYRIGGEDLPLPPEVEEGTAQFRPLSWADVDPDLGGESEGIAMSAAGIGSFFFAPDENMAPAVRELGGSLEYRFYSGYGPDARIDKVADGDPETSFEESNQSISPIIGRSFYFDLGGRFPVRLIRVYSPAGKEDRYIDHIFVATAAGSGEGTGFGLTQSLGDLSFNRGVELRVAREIQENKKALVEIPLDGTPIRHILIHIAPQEKIWEIAEIEIYGGGFRSEASYRSNIIDLGEFSTLGKLRWSGRRDPQARVAIRSRAGDDDDPTVYWRKTFRGDEQVSYGPSGAPLTRRDYKKLEPVELGDITHDAANWELWSAPYEFGDSLGVLLRVAKTSRYVQFEVDFSPFRLDGGRLHFVEFAVSPRSVTDLVGEIDPWQVEVAALTPFTFVTRPTIEPGDRGFDGLDLRLSGGRIAAVEAVRINGQEVAFEKVDSLTTEERAVVYFPRIDINRGGDLLEVVVQGEIFRYGATFEGRAIDSKAPQEVGQFIRPGEATEQVDGNRLSVQTVSLGAEVLGALTFSPAAFTPNGDGVNDAVEISYELLKVTSPIPVQVRLWDLSGRLVRELYAGEDGAGRHPRPWDGRDGNARLVSPGLYICQVEVESEEGQEQQMGVLSIAY